MKKLTACAFPLVQLVAVAVFALALTGCNTAVKKVDANKWAEAYYAQPNTADLIVVEGTNVSWKIENARRIVFSTPVPQKSIIPRDPTWTESFFDTAKSIAPWLMFGWMVHDSGGLGDHSTVNNNAAAQ